MMDLQLLAQQAKIFGTEIYTSWLKNISLLKSIMII